MTVVCDNCGREVSDVIIKKPKLIICKGVKLLRIDEEDGVVIDRPWWKFWGKKQKICQMCAYAKEFGKTLTKDEYDELIKPEKEEGE